MATKAKTMVQSRSTTTMTLLTYLSLLGISSITQSSMAFTAVRDGTSTRIHQLSTPITPVMTTAAAARRSSSSSSSLCILSATKGFGKPSSNEKNNSGDNGKRKSKTSPSTIPYPRTYGPDILGPVQGVMDVESAMNEFFTSWEEWHPLFRTLAVDETVPAMTFLQQKPNVVDTDEQNSNDGLGKDTFEFHEDTTPWKRLPAITATSDRDKEVLGSFLDAMQQSLVDIPVNELVKEDDNDLHFIEEGRRMLVCERFHVLHDVQHGSVDSYDSLFSVLWNEIAELSIANEIDTGSIIVVPGFQYDDLRLFADMNLQRPLQWLGINDFELATLERGGLGVVRLIHKLSDVPSLDEKDEQ